MIRQILMVVDTETFASRSIASSLTARGLVPVFAQPQYSSLPQAKDCPPAVLMCLKDWNIDRKHLMPVIRDLLRESRTLFFMAGDKYDIEDKELHHYFQEYLSGIFYRPFNAEQIAETIETRYDAYVRDPQIRQALVVPKEVQQKRILIVDDNPTSLRALRSVLHAQYKVIMTDSGMGAFNYLEEHIPDLILLDYEMPVLNGPQFLAMVRARERLQHIPVIFLTGKSSREVVMEVMSYKPEGYILKSTPNEEILQKIADFFAGRRG